MWHDTILQHWKSIFDSGNESGWQAVVVLMQARQSGGSSALMPCLTSNCLWCHVWHGMPSSRPRCRHVIRPTLLLMPCPTWCASCILVEVPRILFYRDSKDRQGRGEALGREENGHNLGGQRSNLLVVMLCATSRLVVVTYNLHHHGCLK